MDKDVRTIFRKLVTNEYMPDFDYKNTRFIFKTVFSVSKYMYNCCACGFEHEYLDYLGYNGKIDEEIYNRVVQSIVDGKCPHVDEANEKHTTTTGLYASHIAVVLGTEGVVDSLSFDSPASSEWDSDSDSDSDSGSDIQANKSRPIPPHHSIIFNLDPFILALMKNISIPPMSVVSHFTSTSKLVKYAHRSAENNDEIILESVDYLELCVRNKNETLLEALPLFTNIRSSVLRKAFGGRTDSILNLLMQKVQLTNPRSEFVSQDCCRLAILYDRPDILQTHLRRFSSTFHVVRRELEKMLHQHCLMIERPRCKEVLLKFFKYEHTDIPLSELVPMQIQLLVEFYTDGSMRDEILAALSRIKAKCGDMQRQDFLKIYSKRKLFRRNNIKSFKTVLDIGAELYGISPSDITHLDLHLSDQFSLSLGVRQMLELLLYENPVFEGNMSVFTKGLGVDNGLSNTSFGDIFGLNESLLLDAKAHGTFNHDGNREFPLNFVGPLLIECGAPYSADIYQTFLSRYRDKALQPSEKQYISHSLETLRPLTLRCRDVLRQHFKGRQIHDFVRISDMPQKVRDFIVLKSVLKYIPDDLVY